MVADLKSDLEDIVLSRRRSEDTKAKQNRTQLTAEESEILWNEKYLEQRGRRHAKFALQTDLRGELDPKVAVFSEWGGKELEKHPALKLISHQARVGPARKKN